MKKLIVLSAFLVACYTAATAQPYVTINNNTSCKIAFDVHAVDAGCGIPTGTPAPVSITGITLDPGHSYDIAETNPNTVDFIVAQVDVEGTPFNQAFYVNAANSCGPTTGSTVTAPSSGCKGSAVSATVSGTSPSFTVDFN